MMLYAELPLYRARQIFIDLFVLAWVVVWMLIGRFIFELIAKLAEPARLIQGAGDDLAENASGAAGRVDGVPLLGRYLEAPFQSLERTGRTLQEAGGNQEDAVLTIALWLGILVAALPILFVLLQWGVRRRAWMRQASAARRIRSDPGNLQLLALRAVATRPLADLWMAGDDPAEAYRSGDYARLAALELNRLGLKAPG
ncbi:MAG: hypothetical protein WD645_03310 [Dehalococcoidia bacterium]